jgi:hypothetical protein
MRTRKKGRAGRNTISPMDVGLEKQLGHRDPDPLIKDADLDFPEPGLNPEHSGER